MRCLGRTIFVCIITVRKTGGLGSSALTGVADFVLWYSRSRDQLKYRSLVQSKDSTGTSAQYGYAMSPTGGITTINSLPDHDVEWRAFQPTALHTMYAGVKSCLYPIFEAFGKTFRLPVNRQWSTTLPNMMRIIKAGRLYSAGNTPRFIRFLEDYSVTELNNVWTDVMGARDVIYVVQTNSQIIQRCILMTTDPGDLVLDPTCGAGTTAYVSEQWGRRWITIDTSRVALALARARIMGARYPYYILADSRDGQLKEAEISRRAPSEMPTYGNVRQGFVYERVPHITLRDIANNAEIDVIWEEYQEKLEPLRKELNRALQTAWEEWEIPRDADESWLGEAAEIHRKWWELRIARQREIDASIAARAEYEYLYDKPYEDRSKVRVAGPFTVESISPHRVLGVDENGDVIDGIAEARNGYGTGYDFGQIILDILRRSGVQQAHREDRISFTSLTPWPGHFVCADGRYVEGGSGDDDDDDAPAGPERRAAVFIGPEFGTVSRPDLVEAAREAADGGFDVLIACAFNYDAHTTEFESLGRVPVLKARMNADLHMASELRNTGSGNLFVIFGEPDIDVLDCDDGQVQVRVNGVDVFHPNTGEVRSDGPEGIACWFIDTDYNQESFFVRHAYFLGAGDPYKSLKTTLKAEIDEDAWATLCSATSRPFPRPESGRIAVKVINHLGDEVMKLFRVE